jgi:hypothetical protein
VTTSFSTPRGDFWSVSRHGGATQPARVFVMACGDTYEMPCGLTPNQARELADSLRFEADRADDVNGARHDR